MSQHKNIALQFSGGKDSLCVLYEMKEYWDKLTVYYLNSGNAFPETLELIAHIKAMVPHFVEIQGRQPQTLKEMGWPTDILSVGNTAFGHQLGHTEIRLNDRYTCCYKSIMMPLHERMITDKITLIIRGQKNADDKKPELRSGDYKDQFQFLYPIENWTNEDIWLFLNQQETPIPQYYKDGMTSAPDCMNCTAWLEHKMPAYVKKYHPEHYPELQDRLNTISISIQPYVDELKRAIQDT